MEPAIIENAVDFLRGRESVEGVVMRIGLHNTQLIMVDETGEWIRLVLPSPEAARNLGERLGIPVHDGYPDHLRQRMGRFKRTPEQWAGAPYPEKRGR